jgi:hypothetical protein
MLIKKRRRKIIRESKAEGVRDTTSRLQDESKAAEEGARQSEDAKGLSAHQCRCSSRSTVSGS